MSITQINGDKQSFNIQILDEYEVIFKFSNAFSSEQKHPYCDIF